MNKLVKIVCGSVLLLPMIGLAEVPVIDASSNGIDMQNNRGSLAVQPPVPQKFTTTANASPVPSATTKPVTLDQVSQQVSYLQQLNLPAQIQQLQQQVQRLQGLVEIQGHQIQQLQSQVRSQYTDLNNRLTGSSKTNTMNNAASMPTAMTNNIPSTSNQPNIPSTTITDHSQNMTATKANNQSASSPKSSADQETAAYEAAFTQIKNRKYSEAIQSLNDYLTQYTDGRYVPNAHYWLGELYAISGEGDRAEAELTLVATHFTTSDKAPNAMLKLGNMAFEQHNMPQAKVWWQKLVKKYPESSAARIAKTHLQQLEQAG